MNIKILFAYMRWCAARDVTPNIYGLKSWKETNHERGYALEEINKS